MHRVLWNPVFPPLGQTISKIEIKGPFTQAIFAAIQAAIPAATPNRPCKPAAISWRFVATKSLRFRTCPNFELIYCRFFQFESNKNLLWCTPECSLTQTWRTLLVTRLQKSRQKKEKAPKEARKLGRFQKKNI